MRGVDVRQKVERLLALATAGCHSQDGQVQEAVRQEQATAALVACRLIVENKLLQAHGTPRASASWPPPPPPPPPRRESRQASRGKAVPLVTKFDGRCRWCGKSYHEGDRVMWRKGVGAVLADHADCLRWLEKQKPPDRGPNEGESWDW